MALGVYKIFSVFNMPAGNSGTYLWNNVPKGKAYHIDVQPFYPGSFQEGYSHTVLAEVTRVWRRYRSIQKKGSIGVTVDVHEDIQFVVKNIGSKKTHFNVYLVVFS